MSHVEETQVSPGGVGDLKTTRCVTIRISDIPIEKSLGDLENDLLDIGSTSPAAQDIIKTAERITLAKASEDSACATVTLHSSKIDTELLHLFSQASKQKHLPYQYDSTFYGITPLCEAKYADATE
jgi:hypothetical protein